MVAFRPAMLAKQPGNNLPPFFYPVVLLVLLLPVRAAGNSCDHYKTLVLKPTNVYSHCDIKIPREKTTSSPTIAFPTIAEATSTNLTTILMLSPKGQNSVHWLRADIPKDLLVNGTSSGDNDVIPYKGPKPPKDTGEFTYQFYLFSQPYAENVTIEPYVDRFEKNFKMEEFKSANGMEVIGFFQYRTEYGFNSSRRFSVSILLGLISLALGVLLWVKY